MIFVTVGTQFPFDRLVLAVDEAVAAGLLDDEVFAQIGRGGRRPAHMRWTETLERDAYCENVTRSRAVIGHAGTGTIVDALEAGKPLLVMPRLKRLGEIVNDHQVSTAAKFAALGHVLAAENEADMPARIAELMTFVPRPRVVRPEGVVARVKAALDAFEAQGSGGGRR